MMSFLKFIEALNFPIQPNNYSPPTPTNVYQQNNEQEGEKILNMGIPHLSVLSELGIKRPNHFYRAVKTYAAVQDFLQSGLVKNSDNSPPMYSPDAYPKYMFEAGSNVGFVFEILPPNGHLQTPEHPGLDPAKKSVYKTAIEPTKKDYVTRIFEIKLLPLDEKYGKYKKVHWKIIWSNS